MHSVISYFGTIVVLATAAPGAAATPASWAKVDAASEAACIKASALVDATASLPTRFSDRLVIEARIIEGRWPQPHMKGAKTRMLCLFNRKNNRVEVQELAAPPAPAPAVKDVWWRAEDIGGRGIVDRSEVSLMLGSDGKIGGKSGCNGYSASFQITDATIKVYPPMIGTRMACSPALMTQEQAYKNLVETALSFTVSPEGALVIKSADGSMSRFVRK